MSITEKSKLKSWIIAARPKTLSAGVVPVLCGIVLVNYMAQPIHWGIAFATLAAAVLIQIGTNYINDAVDFKKGADGADRLGPTRVTVSGQLSYKQVMMGGIVCFILAFACGIPLVIAGGWPIVLIGLISIALGFAYTMGPIPLAYKGLGDIFVIIFFGLLAVGGTYYLQTGQWAMPAWVLGLQVGCLATVLLVINNLRDIEQDRAANKKTLVVRFGKKFARFEIAALLGIAIFASLYWVLQGRGYGWAGAIVIFFPAIDIVREVYKTEPSTKYNEFLEQAASIHLLFGVSVCLGLLFT